LNGGSFTSQALDNLKPATSESLFVQLEGELYRKANEGKLKRYWYCLLGKELYCYKKKDDEKHKDMHSLIGVFVKSEKEETLDASTIIFPFKIIFPMSKVRVYYCKNRDERSKWLSQIKAAIGYSQVEDYYEILGDLGKGKFG
jgi:serine/threonine protein kinase